jgi:hypothetical protein
MLSCADLRSFTMRKSSMEPGLIHKSTQGLEVEYRGERDTAKTTAGFSRGRMVPGYTHLGSEVVHHILATAFHGEQPSEKLSSEPARCA